MPEFKLKNGEVVSGLVENEDENYIYLLNAVKKNTDGSVTSYYRYWIEKSDLAKEEESKEGKEEIKAASETPKPKRRRRKR